MSGASRIAELPSSQLSVTNRTSTPALGLYVQVTCGFQQRQSVPAPTPSASLVAAFTSACSPASPANRPPASPAVLLLGALLPSSRAVHFLSSSRVLWRPDFFPDSHRLAATGRHQPLKQSAGSGRETEASAARDFSGWCREVGSSYLRQNSSCVRRKTEAAARDFIVRRDFGNSSVGEPFGSSGLGRVTSGCASASERSSDRAIANASDSTVNGSDLHARGSSLREDSGGDSAAPKAGFYSLSASEAQLPGLAGSQFVKPRATLYPKQPKPPCGACQGQWNHQSDMW